MNILVTGACGQLGREMQRVAQFSRNRFFFTDVVGDCGRLDITDLDAVRKEMKNLGVDIIVNCAAYTNVDKAEDEPDNADMINRLAVKNLATACAEFGTTLIHVSTDYVFQGERPTPCCEDWSTEPNGVYGRTKLAGEDCIRESGCKYVIIRTAWLYSRHGKNFVKTMRQLTRDKDSLKVVFDQVGTPTFAGDLADVIGHIIEKKLIADSGIYHFSNEGAISWYDFAKEICELSGNTCDIQPCHSDEFPSKVKRPHFSVLDKTKIKNTFGIKVPYWKESLRKCIKQLEEDERQ